MQDKEFDELIARLTSGLTPAPLQEGGLDLSDENVARVALRLLQDVHQRAGPFSREQHAWAQEEVVRRMVGEGAAQLAARENVDHDRLLDLLETIDDGVVDDAPFRLAAAPPALAVADAAADGPIPLDEPISVNGRDHRLFHDRRLGALRMSVEGTDYSFIELMDEPYPLQLDGSSSTYLILNLSEGDIADVVDTYGHGRASARAG